MLWILKSFSHDCVKEPLLNRIKILFFILVRMRKTVSRNSGFLTLCVYMPPMMPDEVSNPNALPTL